MSRCWRPWDPRMPDSTSLAAMGSTMPLEGRPSVQADPGSRMTAQPQTRVFPGVEHLLVNDILKNFV